MKKAIALLVITVVAVAGLYVFFKEDLDRFNPLYEEEYVYVMINKPAEPDNRRFKYQLSGYNEEGKERKVRFSASVDLEQGTYLKVLAKGAFTKSWESVKEEDLPPGVKFGA